jgi:hypothetical protein
VGLKIRWARSVAADFKEPKSAAADISLARTAVSPKALNLRNPRHLRTSWKAHWLAQS